ncbi:MAG: hypothetical protein LBC99_02825 [Spirochaetota bacterium]|jgi:tetratricopeptide (TPR) repeat protein|nr:hypothetical protein [Spirochaetota bacterium]
MKIRISIILFFALLFPISLSAAFNTSFIPSLFPAFASADEEKLVRELEKKKLSSFTFLDASLIASGASPESLDGYRQKYRSLSEKIRRDLPTLGLDAMSRAAKIFELMFKYAMSTYKSEQTTLLEILNEGSFNCVSATLLYNLLAEEYGYETQAVVVPEHVYSQIRIGGNWIDAETTASGGFHPLRKPENAVSNRYYIEDKGKNGQKTFMPAQRLIALLYYNRGTLSHHQGNDQTALGLLFRGLLIFPEHIESQENFLSFLIDWAQKESRAGRSAAALGICDEAERALGAHKDLIPLREYVVFESAEQSAKKGDFAGAVSAIEQYLNSLKNKKPDHVMILRGYLLAWAQQSQQQRSYEKMLDLIKRASKEGLDAQADSMSLFIITEAAKQIAKDEGFEKGCAFYDKQYPKKNESLAVQQNRLYLHGLWINSHVASKKYEEAYLLCRNLQQSYPDNKDMQGLAVWIVQKWADDWAAASKDINYINGMSALYMRHQDPAIANELVNRAIRDINQLQQNKFFERACENLRILISLKLGAENTQLINEMYRVVLNNWGIYHAERAEFAEAIEIGKRARKLFPGDPAINTNLANFYYSAGVEKLNRQQYDAAAKIANEGLTEFPGNAGLLKLRQLIPR